LTGTSSLISGLILIFEWWYFKKYGTSFIEQVSLNYIANPNETDPSAASNNNSNGTFIASQSQSTGNQSESKLDTADAANNQLLLSSSLHACTNLNCTNSGSCSNLSAAASLNAIPECKVWKNPMSLMRGPEYNQLTLANNKEPLTFYDMNLSAQDHQTFFTCDSDEGKPDYEIMQRAWRERNQSLRLSLAHEALAKNQE
jgi:hypothetical protein